METATPVANGSAPAVVERPLDRIRREAEERLSALLAPIRARRAQLEAELRDLNGEEEEILAVASALHVKAPKAPKKKAAGPAKRYASQKTLDDVYAFIARANKSGKDATSTEIREGTGLSESVVHGAVRTLREEERIRLTGTRRTEGDDRTGGKPPATYAVMTND